MENNICDEVYVSSARAGDTAALESLMNRYKPLVRARAKEYFLSGGDAQDLIQEGMIGLYKAVLDFDTTRGVKFSTFATLCVVRQIQTAIKAATRQKHLPLNTSLSLHTDNTLDETVRELPTSGEQNPETLLIGREAYMDIDLYIKQNLTGLEYDVLMQHMDGKSHLQIAEAIGKNKKTVDNALQRVRKKIAEGMANDR